MKVVDLFSGIGGFGLASEWCWGSDLEIISFVEIDKYCQKVLKKHWPDVPVWDDVKTFEYDGEVDLITGGFPCQDVSIAGKGEGIEGNRSGLWSEFKRIISEVRPRFALIENVPALTFRGLNTVLCDLAEIGYDVEWQSVSAAEMGAWHKRERIWIVAYPTEQRLEMLSNRYEIFEGFDEIAPDSFGDDFTKKRIFGRRDSEFIRRDYGIPNRVDRLKGLGNAIVPQVAYVIMQRIKEVMEKNIDLSEEVFDLQKLAI